MYYPAPFSAKMGMAVAVASRDRWSSPTCKGRAMCDGAKAMRDAQQEVEVSGCLEVVRFTDQNVRCEKRLSYVIAMARRVV